MSKLQLIRANSLHVPKITELLEYVQLNHYKRYPERFRDPSDVDLRELVAKYLLDESRLVFVALQNELVIGYIVLCIERAKNYSLNYIPDVLLVEQIVVDQEAQGQGVGKALLLLAEEQAKERGIELLELDVWSFNENAQKSFSNFGFVCYNQKMWKSITSDSM